MKENTPDFLAVKTDVLAAVESVFAQTDLIQKAAGVIIEALEAGNKVLWCGNGGSAAEAQHMSAELMVRFLRERGPLASLALSTDTSLMTAHTNDYEYETLFSRQVEGLGRPGDVLVAISTSGKSPNVVRAIQQARRQGLKVIGLFGSVVRDIDAACDVAFHVNSTVTARIQEGHTLIDHLLCDWIDRHFAAGS